MAIDVPVKPVGNVVGRKVDLEARDSQFMHLLRRDLKLIGQI